MKKSSLGAARLAVLVFGLALVVRLLYLFGFAELEHRSYDEWEYLTFARMLWDHGVFGLDPQTPSANNPVLYPLFLAPLVGLLGEGAIWILVLQVVLGATAVALLAQAAARLGGMMAGLLAGVLAASYVQSLLLASRFLTETLAQLWLALGLYLLVRACGRAVEGLPSLAVAAGTVFGLMALTRVVTFPLVLVAASVFAARSRGEEGVGRRWLLPLLVVLSFVAVYSPWVVRNRVSLGKTVVLLEGEKERVDAIALRTAEGVEQGMSFPEARRYSRTLVGADTAPIVKTPATRARHFLQRLGIMLGAHPVLELPFPFAGSRLPVRGWVNAFHFCWHPVLFAGVLLCAGTGVRRRDPARMGLVLVPMALLFLHAMVHALPRYQLLVFFGWTAAAGVGWADLLQRPGWYRRWGKRGLDLALTILALTVLLPVFLIVGAAVLFTLGTPVLFRQRRPGKDARPFVIMKFRTLEEAFDEGDEALPDEARKTRLGELLRRFSLDELPELVNVLRGEMSLVGPRPLLVEYLPRYTAKQARRHEVKPGITGWAQIHGRNLLSWEEKFQLDVWYVDHVSLGLDLKILALTVWKVVKGDGISAQGHATMPRFRGTDGGGGT